MNPTKTKKSVARTLLTLVLTLSLCLSLLLPMGAFAAGGKLVLTDVSYDGGVRFTFDCSSDALYAMCQSGVGMTVNDEALTFNPNYSYHAYYSAAGEFIKESGDNALYATAADFHEGDNTVVFTDPDGAATAYNVNKKTTTETVEYWYGTGDLDGTIPVLENYPVDKNAPVNAVRITAQPKDYTGKVNSTAKFTVSAVGSGLTYQWQISDDGGKTWTNSSVKAASYSTKLTAAKNGRMVQCIVTNARGAQVISDAVSMNIG